jgi:hypothetical protein
MRKSSSVQRQHRTELFILCEKSFRRISNSKPVKYDTEVTIFEAEVKVNSFSKMLAVWSRRVKSQKFSDIFFFHIE